MNPQLSSDLVTFAPRPLDVDVTVLYGYGFPRYRSGLMEFADSVCLVAMLADICIFT